MALIPKIKYDGLLLIEADFSSGERFDIIAAVTEGGQCPFYDEFYMPLVNRYSESLGRKFSFGFKDKTNFTTIKYYFEKISKMGPWSNNTQLRPLQDGFFEFKCKATGMRIPFYYDESNRRVIVVTHYFQKGSQKTPSKELERMKQIKISFESYRKTKDKSNGEV